MQKYAMELIGTFFLVLTIGLTAAGGAAAGNLAPVAIGCVLMVMVYAGGHISGAHYNPAVTLAVWMRGKCETNDIPGYIIAQLVGAAAAAGIVMVIRNSGPASDPATMDIIPALVAELAFTFALAFVILNVATAKATEGNHYFGLAIGLTVTAGAYAVGSVSGGAFNPAVAVGVTILGMAPVAQIWIYLLANFAGGALAALAFKAIHKSG